MKLQRNKRKKTEEKCTCPTESMKFLGYTVGGDKMYFCIEHEKITVKKDDNRGNVLSMR